MAVVMEILTGDGGPTVYLKGYDLNAHGSEPYPTGTVQFTQDLAEALRFQSAAAAFSAWQEPSRAVPLRPDGEPNRPLTAFTVTFVTV